MTGKKWVVLLGAVLAVFLFFYFDLERFLTLAQLKAHREELLAYYGSHRLRTVSLFLLVYVLQSALSLPGAALMSLAAGAVFGPFLGTLYAVLGATCGATLAFLGSRYLFRESVVSRFAARLAVMNAELDARGGNYLLFLRLVPLFPFFLINLAAGLTRLSWRTFVITTFFGIIPGGFVYCNAGASLASVESLKGVVSGRVLVSFGLLGLFALLPPLYARWKGRK